MSDNKTCNPPSPQPFWLLNLLKSTETNCRSARQILVLRMDIYHNLSPEHFQVLQIYRRIVYKCTRFATSPYLFLLYIHLRRTPTCFSQKEEEAHTQRYRTHLRWYIYLFCYVYSAREQEKHTF